MNGHLIRNILKLLVAFPLYYCGIWRILWSIIRVNGLYIFNYHSFNSFLCDYWRFGSLFKSDYRKQFKRQIHFFHKYFRPPAGLPPVLSDFESPTYYLTFDDGYRDNYEIALPLLIKYKVPAVFFITTGVIGTNQILWYDRIRLKYERFSNVQFWKAARLKRNCARKLNEIKKQESGNGSFSQNFAKSKGECSSRLMMSWEEVAEAAYRNILVGSHTHNHLIMSSIDQFTQEQEIDMSMEMIEEHLHKKTILFAYPDGGKDSFGPETLKLLKTKGIKAAFTTRSGVNRSNDNYFLLKRIGINPSDPVPIVAFKLLLASFKDSTG